MGGSVLSQLTVVIALMVYPTTPVCLPDPPVLVAARWNSLHPALLRHPEREDGGVLGRSPDHCLTSVVGQPHDLM